MESKLEVLPNKQPDLCRSSSFSSHDDATPVQGRFCAASLAAAAALGSQAPVAAQGPGNKAGKLWTWNGQTSLNSLSSALLTSSPAQKPGAAGVRQRFFQKLLDVKGHLRLKRSNSSNGLSRPACSLQPSPLQSISTTPCSFALPEPADVRLFCGPTVHVSKEEFKDVMTIMEALKGGPRSVLIRHT